MLYWEAREIQTFFLYRTYFHDYETAVKAKVKYLHPFLST